MTESDRRQRLISSTPHVSPDEVATRQFAKRPRGYAESEVRSYLKRVSDELVAARDREQELVTTIDALEEQLRQPRPLTEQELLDSLGEETARLLRSAREAGDDIRKRAEETAARVIEDARDAASRLRGSADDDRERRIAETDAKVADMIATVEARATEVRDAASAEAETIHDTARTHGREMLEEAKAARERVLGDLVRRRALLTAQIDELRGGRDRLLDAYRTVKRTFLEATEALAQVEAHAAVERGAHGEALDVDAEVAAEIEALDANAAATPPEDAPEDATAVVDVVAVEAAEVAISADDDSGNLADVDSLFARLRAGHDEAAPTPAPAGAAAETAEDQPGTVVTEAPPEPAVATGDTDAAATAAAAADEPVVEAEPAVQFSAIEWRSLRAQELDPLLAPLLKRTKRTVQDDQNSLLDAVRRYKGRPNAAQVLPDDDALLSEWSAVLQDSIDVAYASGRVAAGGESRDAESALVREAAAAVIEPLRARVTVAIDSGDEGDTGGLVERIGARYREWKNQSLEVSLAEVLALAWSRGVYDAVPDDAVLWWVPFEEGRCSDCDDNGLEPTKKSELFPTGQAFPPAHRGCRCLLAPANLLKIPTVA